MTPRIILFSDFFFFSAFFLQFSIINYLLTSWCAELASLQACKLAFLIALGRFLTSLSSFFFWQPNQASSAIYCVSHFTKSYQLYLQPNNTCPFTRWPSLSPIQMTCLDSRTICRHMPHFMTINDPINSQRIYLTCLLIDSFTLLLTSTQVSWFGTKLYG